uniref:Uncharacterized protein n=1 Tax=Clytia hemisphaerica TaxID=252671 RepID=A0A7M5X223_9CNID
MKFEYALLIFSCLMVTTLAGDPFKDPLCREKTEKCVADLKAWKSFRVCEPYVRCHYDANDPALKACVDEAINCENGFWAKLLYPVRFKCAFEGFHCMEKTH